jgi:hypothetical protein
MLRPGQGGERRRAEPTKNHQAGEHRRGARLDIPRDDTEEDPEQQHVTRRGQRHQGRTRGRAELEEG